MSKTNTVKVCTGGPFRLLLSVATAMVGYQIHGSVFWSFVDFFFYPIAIVKWLIYHEVNLSVIKQAFSFFLQ